MPQVTGEPRTHLGKADFCAEPIHRYCRKNTFLVILKSYSVSMNKITPTKLGSYYIVLENIQYSI